MSVSREQGQAAQRRVADGAIRLGVAPERSPRGPLDPLRGRGAEHPPARPGLPGTRQRNLREVGGPGERGEGQKRGHGGRRAEGVGLTRRAPAALAAGPGSRLFRIRAWTATCAAACEVREGAACVRGFAWGARVRGVTASGAVGPGKAPRRVLRARPTPPTHEGGSAVAPGSLSPLPRPLGGGGWSGGAELCLRTLLAPPGASVGRM